MSIADRLASGSGMTTLGKGSRIPDFNGKDGAKEHEQGRFQQLKTAWHKSKKAGDIAREVATHKADAYGRLQKDLIDHAERIGRTSAGVDAARVYRGLASMLQQEMAIGEQTITSTKMGEMVSHIHLGHETREVLKDCLNRGMLSDEDFAMLCEMTVSDIGDMIRSSRERASRIQRVLQGIEMSVTDGMPQPGNLRQLQTD